MECTAQAIRSATVKPSPEKTFPMNITPTPIPDSGTGSEITITLGAFVIIGCLVAGFLIYLIYRKEIRSQKKK